MRSFILSSPDSRVAKASQYSCHQSPVVVMSTVVAYVIPFVVLFVLLGGLASFLLLWKRLRGRFLKKRRRAPTSAELRQMRIPVIESTPFWVPGKAGDLIGIEIQPSPSLPMPITFSTPKPRRVKVVRHRVAF